MSGQGIHFLDKISYRKVLDNSNDPRLSNRSVSAASLVYGRIISNSYFDIDLVTGQLVLKGVEGESILNDAIFDDSISKDISTTGGLKILGDRSDFKGALVVHGENTSNFIFKVGPPTPNDNDGSNGLALFHSDVRIDGNVNILKDTGINREVLIEGNLKVIGNITATEDLTYTTVQDMKVEDNVISLNYTESSPGVPTITNPNSYSGIRIFRGSSQPSASLYWDENDQAWNVNYFKNLSDPRIKNVGDPKLGSDAVNKSFVIENRSRYLGDLLDVNINFDYSSDNELIDDWNFANEDGTNWSPTYIDPTPVSTGEVNDDGQDVLDYPTDPTVNFVGNNIQIQRSDLSVATNEAAVLTVRNLTTINGSRNLSFEVFSADFTYITIEFVINGSTVHGPINLSGETTSYTTSFVVTGQTEVFDLEIHVIPTTLAPSPSPLVSLQSISLKYNAVGDFSNDKKALLFDYNNNEWVSSKIDYTDLTNPPDSSAYTFAGLSDTTDAPLNKGYLRWNFDGSNIDYSTTIAAIEDAGATRVVTGLSEVAYVGEIDQIDDININFGTGDNTDPLVASQFLYYDKDNSEWINKSLDQIDLSADPLSIVDLIDVENTPTSGAYLKWNTYINQDNAEVIFTNTISAEDIQGLAPIAYTGDLEDASSINISFKSLIDVDELSTDPNENGLLVWGDGTDWIDGQNKVVYSGVTKTDYYDGKTLKYIDDVGGETDIDNTTDGDFYTVTKNNESLDGSVFGFKIKNLNTSGLGTHEDEVIYRIDFYWEATSKQKGSNPFSFELKHSSNPTLANDLSSASITNEVIISKNLSHTWIKDSLTQEYIRILDKDLPTPPVTPGDRDAYIVPDDGSAAWGGIPDYNIAIYDIVNEVWVSRTPDENDAVYVVDEDLGYYFSGGTWTATLDLTTKGYTSFEFQTTGDDTDQWVQLRLNEGYVGDSLEIDIRDARVSIGESIPTDAANYNYFYNGDFTIVAESEWGSYSRGSSTSTLVIDSVTNNELVFTDTDASTDVKEHFVFGMFYANAADLDISFEYDYNGGGTEYILSYAIASSIEQIDLSTSDISFTTLVNGPGTSTGISENTRIRLSDYALGTSYLLFRLLTNNQNDSFTIRNIKITKVYENYNVIRYDGGINDASDVDTSSPITDGQALLWQTDKWVPSNLAKELYTWVVLDSIVASESNGPELSNGVGYVVNTSGVATPEVYLPKYPQPNDSIGIVVNGPNPLTINGNGPYINGKATVTLGSDGDSISLVYPGDLGNGFSGEWEILNSGVGGGGGNATAILLSGSGDPYHKLEAGNSYYLDSVNTLPNEETPGIIAHLPDIPSNGDTIKVYGAASGEGYVYADESDNPPNLIRTKDGDFAGIIVDFLGEITFVWIGDAWNTSSVPLPEYTHPTHTARNVDTTGADIIDAVTSDAQGHVTDVTSRTLTLGELGFTGDTNANNYTHPTGDGYEHIPAGGQLGQYLASDGAGSVVWHNSMVVHNKSGNATYTLVASDNGASMWFNDPSVTVTVPIGLPSGFNILIRNKGGTLTVQPQNTEVLINDVNASFIWDDPSRYHTVLLEYIDETPDPDVFYYVVVGNTTQV